MLGPQAGAAHFTAHDRPVPRNEIPQGCESSVNGCEVGSIHASLISEG
jgi:hypothetical protein